VGELPETGVDSVDRLAAKGGRFDRLPGLLDRLDGLGIERHGGIPSGYGDDVGNGQGTAIECDGLRHGDKS
jgi:hypothetical protein